jgi:hypothetical protein
MDVIMDQRLKAALDFSNYRKVLFNHKQDLKLKVEARLRYSIDGGTFDIDRELITFVRMLLDDGRIDVVLIDRNQNPIRINDLRAFHEEIFSRYFEATNMYHTEYSRMKSARTVEDLLSMGDK